MADLKVFPEGIKVFPRNAKAPEWVLGTAVITINKFQDWIDSHQGYLTEYQGKQQLKLQILKGKEGAVYFQVDTYQKQNNDNF